MLEKLVQILGKVQFSRSTHSKYIQILMGIYEKSSVDEFIKNFILILRKIFEQDMDKNNLYIKRALEFLSKFSAEVVLKEISNENKRIQQPAVFLPKLLEQVFQYCDLNYLGCRYYSCSFIMQLLDHIGGDVNLDNSVCDMIKEAMLKRLEYEHNLDIRLQAISALSKIQRSRNGGPIIAAYLKCLNDQHNTIRRAVIDVIVSNARTRPAIREGVQDIDEEVRCKAYIRLADMGPFVMYTRHRLAIMRAGITEENPEVKRIFKEVLLTKWLMAYDNDYMKFLKALTLSSTEIDLTHLAPIGKRILRYLFELTPVTCLLESLPIDSERKLIKDTHLNNETILYWYCLIKYLRNDDQYNNYLNQIVPNLAQFCVFIKKICNENILLSRHERAEFEFNIHCFFKILNGFNISNEVELQMTITLIKHIIIKCRFFKRTLIGKFMKILSKCYSEIDEFLNSVSEIITNIREPIISETKEPTSKCEIVNRRSTIAKCVMRISILASKRDEFIASGDHEGVSQINTQMEAIGKTLEDLQNACDSDITITKKITRAYRNDVATICYWLDISIGVMKLSRINKLSMILITFLSDLLLPLASNKNDEVHSRYLECLLQYCKIDKSLALTHYQEIFEPIIIFKNSGYFNLASLTTALIGLADLVCLHGTDVIRAGNCARSIAGRSTAITLAILLDAAVAILDVDNDTIVLTIIETLSKLVKVTTFTSEMISRILLKWFSSLMKKHYDISKVIELFIDTFLKYTKNSIEIIRESIVPVLSGIVTVPNDDYMSSVHFKTVLNFFITWMNTENEVNIKTSIFYIIEKISDDSNKDIVELLLKILLRLNVTVNSIEELDQYVNPVEIIMNKIENNVAKQHLETFISKVRNLAIDNGFQIENNNQNPMKKVKNEINNCYDNVKSCDINSNNITVEVQITEEENQNKASNVGEPDEDSESTENQTPPEDRQLKRKNSQ